MICLRCGQDVPPGELTCSCFVAGGGQPLICKDCGKEIPPNKLACDCFTRRFDEEQESLSIRRFGVNQGWLFMTAPHKHLLPTMGYGLTLCRKQRFKRVDTEAILLGHLPAMEKDARYCQECIAKVRAVLAQSANAGRPADEPRP